jgi:hypothetical protein
MTVRFEKYEDRYQITDGRITLPISQDEFEGLFFAVPISASEFYRLLTDDKMVDADSLESLMGGSKTATLDKIMADIAAFPEPE